MLQDHGVTVPYWKEWRLTAPGRKRHLNLINTSWTETSIVEYCCGVVESEMIVVLRSLQTFFSAVHTSRMT